MGLPQPSGFPTGQKKNITIEVREGGKKRERWRKNRKRKVNGSRRPLANGNGKTRRMKEAVIVSSH